MKKLTEDDELEIRNRLDYISERLHLTSKDNSNRYWQDLHWSYNTIKRLLFKIYELEKQKACINVSEKSYETVEIIRSYMEYDATIMLNEEDRLDGIHKALKEFYRTLEELE